MLRRAGLDYWQDLQLELHKDWQAFLDKEKPEKLFFSTTKTNRSYYDYSYSDKDYLCFGNESSGLPPEFYERYEASLYTIPMPGKHHRSFNLANAVAMVLGEARRQLR